MSASLAVSVVVPSHNSVSTLRTALAGIRASELARELYEVIVVDDASSDSSPSVAARYADKVVRLTGGPWGAAYARNRGAELARGEIVVFVNPDVLIEPDAISTVLEMFAEAQVVAVAGSRDETSGAANIVTEYWNLLLRFGERRYAGGAGDLASGFSAVRRATLIEAGMYDEWRFGIGCLEGIELAQRLHRAARKVPISRELQVVHLKRWTVRSVCREVWNRGRVLARSLDYTRTRLAVPSEVVFTLSSAMPAALLVITLVTLAGAFYPSPSGLVKAMAVAAGVLVANLSLYRFYAKARGLAFAISVVPLHLVSQGISAAALCTGWILRNTVGDRTPDATTQAYAEVGLEKWPPVPRRYRPG